jgi:hypothetical protein
VCARTGSRFGTRSTPLARPSLGRLRPALSLCRAGLTPRPRASGGRWHPRSRRRYSPSLWLWLWLWLWLHVVSRRQPYMIPKGGGSRRQTADGRRQTAWRQRGHGSCQQLAQDKGKRQRQRAGPAVGRGGMALCARHRQSPSTWQPRRRATVWK